METTAVHREEQKMWIKIKRERERERLDGNLSIAWDLP